MGKIAKQIMKLDFKVSLDYTLVPDGYSGEAAEEFIIDKLYDLIDDLLINKKLQLTKYTKITLHKFYE